MGTVSIDHIAMPTADAERLIEFYKRLGFTINDEDPWRAGKANIFSIQIGDSKINVHPQGFTADLGVPLRSPAAPISASSGTGRPKSVSRCWTRPEWKLFGAPARARVPGAEGASPQLACTPGTLTRTCWSG